MTTLSQISTLGWTVVAEQHMPEGKSKTGHWKWLLSPSEADMAQAMAEQGQIVQATRRVSYGHYELVMRLAMPKLPRVLSWDYLLVNSKRRATL